MGGNSVPKRPVHPVGTDKTRVRSVPSVYFKLWSKSVRPLERLPSQRVTVGSDSPLQSGNSRTVLAVLTRHL